MLRVPIVLQGPQRASGGRRHARRAGGDFAAKLEAMEAKTEALMAEWSPIAEEIFAHLPEDERRLVLNSPERARLAFKTLPDNQRKPLTPLLRERLKKF